MATQPEDDALETEQEAPEIEEQQAPPETEGGEEGEEIVFGDEPAAPGERDNGLVKHLREEIRKRDALLASRPDPAAAPIEVGPEPDMDDEDVAYDQEKFKAKWSAWNERKAKAEQQQAKAGESNQQFQQQWQRDLQSYQAKRETVKTRFSDFDDAEQTALASLDPAQQATIVQVADDPAMLLLALGKHPSKLAEIAAITNPLKLAKAITQLEGKMTVKPRSKAPPPEEIESGTGRINHASGAAEKKLAQMEAEFEKKGGGDRSAIVAFKRLHNLK